MFKKIRSYLILILDVITLLCIFSSLYYIRLGQLPNYSSFALWLIIFTIISTLFVSGTYSRRPTTSMPSLPIRTFFIASLAGILCVLWLYLLGPSQFNNYFGRGILPIGVISFGIIATLVRFIINSLHHLHEEGKELLYLGYSNSADEFLNELQNHSEVKSVSILTHKQVEHDLPKNIRFLSKTNSEQALSKPWNEIIIDPKYHTSREETDRLISIRLNGTAVLTLDEYYQRHWHMVPVDHIDTDWFLQSQGFSMISNPVSSRIKRIVDIFLSIFVLILGIPLILVSAVVIKLTSKGPIFFKQVRVGYQNKEFQIYKLRTMIDNAESGGAQWARADDPRITLVGKFLRKSRLDELPQCWNVLRGEMSFVGPRPERPEFTKELTEKIPYYELRHIVKPGITGWAQVIFPYGASIEDSLKKLQYELYYIKNQSLLLDLNIILRTLITVFQRAGR